jgi:hypothetical protein
LHHASTCLDVAGRSFSFSIPDHLCLGMAHGWQCWRLLFVFVRICGMSLFFQIRISCMLCVELYWKKLACACPHPF